MRARHWFAGSMLMFGVLLLAAPDMGTAQPGIEKKDFFKGGKGGPGGGMFGQTRKILKDFDKNNDGWLNAEERKPAREALAKGGEMKGGFMMKGGFGKGGNQGPAKEGVKVSQDSEPKYPDKPLYEPTILRTIFLEFENKDWEKEIQDFHGTDVDVAATMIVDGKTYKNVGVHFRGASSYGMVPATYKRSFNIDMDMAEKKQTLYGYKSLNLLNQNGDASFISTVLYSQMAREHIPAPKASFVKVVINGENWGIYTNVQQFDKVFTKENFNSEKGTRWKVRGSPGGGGGLVYSGDNIEDYKRRYEIKTKDDDKSWKALIKLCKTLAQTPPEKMEEALKPILDIDSLLWFLAYDVALINSDGYWIRDSDYSIYLDEKGKFHIIPHDMNEAFHPGGGPGGRGPGMFMARPGEVLPAPLQDMLGLTDAQKKQLADLQKDTDGKVGKILTEEQNKELKQLRDNGPGGFGPPGGGPPGGPGGLPPVGGPPGGGFGPPGGGFGPPGGGPGGGGVNLDPLINLTDARKPLRSKILVVPSLRAKYLENIRTIADQLLDWKKLGPQVAVYRKLIEKEIEADTKKLISFEAFQRATADTTVAAGGRELPLRAFAEQRRKYLLEYKETKPAPARP
jgi:spore coat protein CotH